MLGCVLGCKNSTEGKALTGMGIVSDGDDISRRIVADAMDSRNLTTANVIYAENVR